MPVPVRAGAHLGWHQEPQLAQEVTRLTPRQSQGWDRAAPPVTMWCLKNWGKLIRGQVLPRHKKGTLALPSLWECNYNCQHRKGNREQLEQISRKITNTLSWRPKRNQWIWHFTATGQQL